MRGGAESIGFSLLSSLDQSHRQTQQRDPKSMPSASNTSRFFKDVGTPTQLFQSHWVDTATSCNDIPEIGNLASLPFIKNTKSSILLTIWMVKGLCCQHSCRNSQISLNSHKLLAPFPRGNVCFHLVKSPPIHCT